MDVFLICRDALENAVIGNVALALDVRRRGAKAAILFTGEALDALAGQSFGWSTLFRSREARITISRGATRLGVLIAAERDDRSTDLPRMLEGARQAGVELFACPIWSEILGIGDSLPASLTRVPNIAALEPLMTGRQVIGAL